MKHRDRKLPPFQREMDGSDSERSKGHRYAPQNQGQAADTWVLGVMLIAVCAAPLRCAVSTECDHLVGDTARVLPIGESLENSATTVNVHRADVITD